MSFYDQSLGVPPDIAGKAMDLKIWMEKFGAKSVYGMGDVISARVQIDDLQRQLDETKALLAQGADLVRDQAAEIGRLNTGFDELQRQLADALAERDAWKGIHDGQQRVYHDIGANLGADMPRELVNEVARRRMAELAAAKEKIDALERECDSWQQAALTRGAKGEDL